MPDTRLLAVARLTDALSRAARVDDVYTAALDALQQSLGVPRAAVLLFDEAGVMSFVASRGISDAYRAAVNGHTPWQPDSPAPEPVCVPDVREDAPLATYRGVFETEGIRALGFFPLVYRDRVIGKFMLYYDEPHACTAMELELASTIAGQIAFGVMRVRAEEQLERERDRLEALARRNAFLDKASAILVSSIDYETTLQNVAQLLVGEICDWCSIDVREDDGAHRRLAVTHRDPSMAEAAKRMLALTADQQRSRGIAQVIETAKPLLVRELEVSRLEEAYRDAPEIVETLRQLGVRSYMTVPLIAGGRSFGAVSLINSQRLFDDDDLALATEVGVRAGFAVDNARLYKQAQEANRAKDEFLATLSHELRTPLTATLGWASMLRTQDLSPENFKLALETIERSTRAQAKLIDDILDVSRIVTGKLQLALAPVALRSVIEAAVDAIRPSLSAKNLELHLSLASTRGVANGDAARLQQVIWNLLSNAVRFTPAGGSVSIALDEPSPEEARVVVRDNGIGISRRLLPYIFERFRQADSSASRSHGGLGLGLAIVKSIVELHGGAVHAESEGEGRGATFTITLPISPAPHATVSAAAESAPTFALGGVSVLLVEDEDDTRYMLSAALQSFGARVTAVRSVAAAFDVLQTTKPHVVVSDIGLPGEDGYSFIMKVRNNAVEHVRTLPAVALTAYARPEDRERILQSGYGYYLAKPIDPLQVVKTVREAITAARA